MACALGIEQPCSECRMCGKGKGGKKMTNGNRIREMNNSELAEIIMCPYKIDEELCNKNISCLECCREWLESECGTE